LGVQAGLTSIANEVVVLVMVGGARSTSALGLRWLVRRRAGDNVDGSASTVFRLAGKTYVRTPVTAPSSRRSGGAREEQGCGGERAAKASGASGGGGGENVGVVDLSSEEPNMNSVRNYV
jgi:hypothetical protein